MAIPYELANTLNVGTIDPNNIIVGRSYYYSDASPAFAIGAGNDSLIQTNEEAVAGQIEIVIGTPVGTDPFEPTFGSQALNYVFENTSEHRGLELEILTSVRRWLGNRLDFFNVTVVSDKASGDTYVSIPFRIKVSGVQQIYVGNLSALKKMAA
jgi:phage baseplate assembly protein W